MQIYACALGRAKLWFFGRGSKASFGPAISFFTLYALQINNLVVDRRTRDREVAGSTLTHCAVKCGPGQAAPVYTHLPLPPSSITTQFPHEFISFVCVCITIGKNIK